MSLSADYPRMLFHRRRQPVVVQSEAEEAALGAEWSRTIPLPGDPELPPDTLRPVTTGPGAAADAAAPLVGAAAPPPEPDVEQPPPPLPEPEQRRKFRKRS